MLTASHFFFTTCETSDSQRLDNPEIAEHMNKITWKRTMIKDIVTFFKHVFEAVLYVLVS